MGVVFPNSSLGGIPRVVTVTDNSGCPAPARSTLLSATVTLSTTSVVIIEGEIIRRNSTGGNRCDSILIGPGYPNISSNTTPNPSYRLDYILDYNDNSSSQWNPHNFRWAGYANSGTHTFYLQAANSSCLYGCGPTWGRMDIMIFDLP